VFRQRLKPTNPTAQKALTTPTHYKLTPRPATRVRPKALSSSASKTQLFDGLDDDEPSLTNGAFVPRSVAAATLSRQVVTCSAIWLSVCVFQEEHQETGAEEPEQQPVQQSNQQRDGRPRLTARVPTQRTQVTHTHTHTQRTQVTRPRGGVLVSS